MTAPPRRHGTLAPLPLAHLLRQARALEALTRALRAELGGALAARCQVIGLRDGILTVAVEGPAWATRLRYLAPDLAARLARRGLAVRSVRLRPLPPATSSPPVMQGARRERPRPPPPAGRRALEEAAAACRDPALRAALRRLARLGAARGRDGPGDPTP